MVTSGRRNAGAVAGLLLSATLAGCAGAPDVARSVQAGVGRLDQVVAAEVTTPTTDRAAAIRLTYAATAADPAGLAAIVAGVEEVAARNDYPAYRLTLVPATEPESELTVDGRPGPGHPRALRAWLAVSDALLGPVSYHVGPSAPTITVDSRGAAAHDVAQARRMRHRAATTWVFRTGSGTFTAHGRIRADDTRLFRAVQRTAGAADLGAAVSAWRLDIRDTHVRLDLDVSLAAPPTTAAELTVARYGRTLSPIVRGSLQALSGAGRPTWLSLHVRDAGTDDTFATWTSGQPPGRGRDPHDRGWDTWLAVQAAAG